MLKDITLGQFFPGFSPVHRLDPRIKLILTVAYVVMLFLANNLVGLAFGILFFLGAYFLARIPLKMMLKGLKPVLPIILFTSVLNMFFITGDPLFSWWVITITRQGVYTAVIMSIRIVCLIAGTSLLTYTTSPISLTDGLERLMGPLKKLRFPVHELAMMMTIALRFIPTLIEETDKIMNAQKARGADMETGSLIDRVKALVPVLIPLFISAFRRADELATAMECRCYHGGEGRTKLHVLRYQLRDYLVLAAYGAVLAAVLILARFGL